MRTLGVELGSQAWEACMMPLHYMRLESILKITLAEFYGHPKDSTSAESGPYAEKSF